MGSYTFTDVAEDHTISARFSGAGTEYVLSKGVSAHGDVALNPEPGVYPEGTTVNVAPSPDPGYRFDRYVTVPAGVVITNNSFTLNQDTTVSAVFVEDSPTPPTPTGETVRIYTKQNGHWVPLFTE